MLQLTRPLAFIDLETTGINLQIDKIVEIAIVKMMPDGRQIVKRKLINPEMPIPAAVSAIHGITDEMVKDAPTFKQAANEIKQFLHNCDVAGFNSNRFDIPLLVEEFLRAGLEEAFDNCKLLDVQRIFHMMEQRTLGAAYKFYCHKTLDNAHSATADATATLEVLLAQLDKYKQLGDTVDSILQYIGQEEIVDHARRFIKQNGVEVFNFGKYKGKSVIDTLKKDPSYYDWMMKGDFSLHTKQKLAALWNKTLIKK